MPPDAARPSRPSTSPPPPCRASRWRWRPVGRRPQRSSVRVLPTASACTAAGLGLPPFGCMTVPHEAAAAGTASPPQARAAPCLASQRLAVPPGLVAFVGGYHPCLGRCQAGRIECRVSRKGCFVLLFEGGGRGGVGGGCCRCCWGGVDTHIWRRRDEYDAPTNWTPLKRAVSCFSHPCLFFNSSHLHCGRRTHAPKGRVKGT